MKIALVYDALFPYVKGGGERRYFELARRLRGSHDVHMVSWQYWPGAPRVVLDGVTYHGAGKPPAFYGADGRRRVSEAASFAMRSLPILAREHFDIVDCAVVPFLPLYTSALASRLRGARLIATWFEFWDAYWLTYRGGISARLARLAERTAVRLGDAHIAISQTTADRMAVCRSPRTQLAIIEPGADVQMLGSLPDLPKTVDVVFAGRLNAQKNVALLLYALAEAQRNGTRITCAILGDGPERARLTKMAGDLALSAHVTFLGRIEDDREYFAYIKQARLFVWPSVAEGFGLAPLEAMACGVPPVIVASTFSATQQLVLHGENGILVAPEPVALARAIQDVLADDSRLQRLSAGAVVRAQRSTWDAMALEVGRVYEDVVARRPLRPYPAPE